MSAWRLLVIEIHRYGPVVGSLSNSGAIQGARILKLIEPAGDHRWKLTPLGLDLAQGRVMTTETRPGGLRFVATWLKSLPQGLRLS